MHLKITTPSSITQFKENREGVVLLIEEAGLTYPPAYHYLINSLLGVDPHTRALK